MDYFFARIPMVVILILILGCNKDNMDKCCECMEREVVESDAYIADETIDLRGIPYAGKVKLLQVPPNALERMCPFGLVESCLGYRLIYLPFAFNNIKEGLEQMHQDFNGMQELIRRPGAQSPFVGIYQAMDPSAYDRDAELLEQGRFAAKFRNIEILMAYGPILDKFSAREKMLILENAIRIYDVKRQEAIFGGASLVITGFLIANILHGENFEEFEMLIQSRPYLIGFINGYLNNLQSVSDGEDIVGVAKNYLIQNY